jgi:hypothetical protein
MLFGGEHEDGKHKESCKKYLEKFELDNKGAFLYQEMDVPQ